MTTASATRGGGMIACTAFCFKPVIPFKRGDDSINEHTYYAQMPCNIYSIHYILAPTLPHKTHSTHPSLVRLS